MCAKCVHIVLSSLSLLTYSLNGLVVLSDIGVVGILQSLQVGLAGLGAEHVVHLLDLVGDELLHVGVKLRERSLKAFNQL